MTLKKFFILVSISLLFAASLFGVKSDQGIDWQRNVEEALKAAKEKSTPIFIDFWADWCPPCRQMERDVWPDKDLIAVSRNFVCISVNSDYNKGFSRAYTVTALPTLIITDPVGNELFRFVGYKDAILLRDVMKRVPPDYTGVKEWVARLKEKRKDSQALLMVAAFYSSHNSPEISNRYFADALNTSAAKNNPGTCERILLSMGMNHLKMADFKKAVKVFKKAAKRFPNGELQDKVLYGLIIAQIRLGKLKEAKKNFSLLQSRYPKSKATGLAAKNF